MARVYYQRNSWAALMLLSPLIHGAKSSEPPFGAVMVIAVSEVYIEQAHGRIMRKPDPSALKPSKPAVTDDASSDQNQRAPVTCNQQNASSQACYSATQQARPVPH